MISLIALTVLLYAPADVHAFPTQTSPCSACHGSDGSGILVVTNATGAAQTSFTVLRGETITIVIEGRGDTHKDYTTGPAIVVEFDPNLYQKITMSGARPGGEGSHSYYIQDGDPNDREPTANDVKGEFTIALAPDTPIQDYTLTVNYPQRGPTGVSSTVTLTVAEKPTPTPAPPPTSTPAPKATPTPTPPLTTTKLDCLKCHEIQLKVHDKLGSGNNACWVCHDALKKKTLRLANETLLPLSDAPKLCWQCHQERYNAWSEGMHGRHGPSYTSVEEKVTCTRCHDPHSPAFPSITPLPPPPPQLPVPPLTTPISITVDTESSQSRAMVALLITAVFMIILMRKR